MQPFVPQALPIEELDWLPLIPAIGEANRALAHYTGRLESIPNPRVLLSPLSTQEAVLSSAMEGTQATLGDVLKFEAGEAPTGPRQGEDIQEILNYRKALNSAETELSRRPFSLGMLKMLHAVLMTGVRGRDKTPGQFRTVQNWIGPENSPIETASFIPPIPEQVVDHLEAWEKYFAGTDRDPLVQLAVIHAQFEIIHPFRDGNGRLGRILIPLFLYEKKVLPKPTFYMSAWLERRKDEYVAKLRVLGKRRGTWNDWVEFFLRGVAEQAAHNAQVADQVLELYDRIKRRALEITRSQFAVPLIEKVFRLPVFRRSQLSFGGSRKPTEQAVYVLLGKLESDGIIKALRKGRGRMPTIYALPELLNICEGRKVY